MAVAGMQSQSRIQFMKYSYILFVLIISSCSQKKDKEIKTKAEKINVIVPKFNADSAYSFIQKQVDFGPRVISSESWRKCSRYLEKKLLSYNANVLVQKTQVTTYDNKKHELNNIIASYLPNLNNRIALFAHWDSRHIADHDTVNKEAPILGANDGGSGVGVLLEIARNLNIQTPSIGVDIILFDAEDYGQPENSKYPVMNNSWCLGSQYWSKNPHKKEYFAKYGILLDMVGAQGATFRHEGISNFYAQNILEKVWSKAHEIGYSNYFVYQKSAEIMDDHYYVNSIAGIPTIDIIEFDPFTKTNFNKHWHTHKDNMDNISKETLKAVGETVINVLYSE
ncbi:M28 family peptidase [Flavobacteriales bacterium]|jgi:Zn-dependent M28 family amino/carboxypeptidase|nr:M28 family peptidase [Flavobacteriales bacterium]